MVIREMTRQDVAEVDRIQRDVYDPSLCETVAVLTDKIRYFPHGCWLCEADTVVVGYMISHPSSLSAPPALNTVFSPNAEAHDCYFIHDIAVQRSCWSRGVGTLLLEQAVRIAMEHGFTTMALVAVQNAQRYWQRFGFQPITDGAEAMRSIRESYGDAACYMSRSLMPTADQCHGS
jgi:N-acetylglutamate synthase-like GNAT family acetyltransferase